jgi:hypothetical protein
VTDREHAEEAGAVRSGLGITAGLCLAELIGGWLTNSLALLTDAGTCSPTRLASSPGSRSIGSRSATS